MLWSQSTAMFRLVYSDSDTESLLSVYVLSLRDEVSDMPFILTSVYPGPRNAGVSVVKWLLPDTQISCLSPFLNYCDIFILIYIILKTQHVKWSLQTILYMNILPNRAFLLKGLILHLEYRNK